MALSAAAFGAMPIFARQAYAAGVDLTGILVPRFAIAALVLALIAWRSGARRPTRRQTLALAALGGIGYVTQAFLYFTALQHASAGLVALLLYAFPFIVAVLAAIFLNERLTARRVAARGRLSYSSTRGVPCAVTRAAAASATISCWESREAIRASDVMRRLREDRKSVV